MTSTLGQDQFGEVRAKEAPALAGLNHRPEIEVKLRVNTRSQGQRDNKDGISGTQMFDVFRLLRYGLCLKICKTTFRF